MERLTYKGTPYMTEDGMVTPAYSDHSIRRIIERLAEYEDTGLTPTMVLDTIRARDTAQKQALENAHIVDDYRIAEEQGLLLRLPCKVGDTVFEIVEEYEEMYEPDSKYYVIDKTKFDLDMLNWFGKCVFLTREEAEQALKQMGE